MQQTSVLALYCLAGAAILVAARLFYASTARGRALARLIYTERGNPYFIRMLPAVTLMLAVCLSIIALALLVPLAFGRPLVVIGVTLGLATFALSYRCPPPMTPGWMREEIRAGTLPLARPDRLDWLQFWVVAPLAVLMPIIGAILIIMGPG